jgi:3D (Asp-Asp-Asp) domain-containing protein
MTVARERAVCSRRARRGSPVRTLTRVAVLVPMLAACSTAGSAWMAEPLSGASDVPAGDAPPPDIDDVPRRTQSVQARTLGNGAEFEASATPAPGGTFVVTASGGTPAAGGRSLGTFRNTYYDFPSETDFEGKSVTLLNQSCKALAEVPQTFFEALCVQGSGTLRRGATVSFAKRDCSCAPVCPKTGQKICFDELDARDFPWGRGATGKAITPLLTVAVDPSVIPLGTPLYVPELDGLPRDPNGTAVHDGCFLAQDKGLNVVGNHVDFFTGHKDLTALWNRRVPSNRGVTVIVESPRCARGN